MKSFFLLLILSVMGVLAPSCMQPSTAGSGGGSEVEVVGSIYLSDSEVAPATQVKLIPCDYDPLVMAPPGDSLIDTSDLQGRFTFKSVAPGKYNMLATQIIQRTRLLVTDLDVSGDTTTIPAQTLREPGAIRVLLLDTTTQNGYAAIPGTDIAVFVASGSSEILLDSVPSGSIPEIRYKWSGDTTYTSNRNVLVEPAQTTTLTTPAWSHMRYIVLNTSSTGADVRGDVYQYPVLIRLGESTFNFTEAQPDGSDLRFTTLAGTSLPCEIEQWDHTAKNGVLWVKVDTIYGNNATQSIIMCWGNPLATRESNSGAVFGTTAGFEGVWHLGDTAGAAVTDASLNGYHGTSPDTAVPPVAKGIIGNGRAFNGTADFISMPNTAGSTLNFPEDGNFTLSAWVYSDAFDNKYRTIAAKGYQQYFLQVSYMPVADRPWWQFSVFGDTAIWNMSHTPAVERQWVYLAGVRSGTTQSLYCNGERVAGTSTVFKQDTTMLRTTADDFSIGRFFSEATFPIHGYCYFKGTLDEVRVDGAARDENWIRLCYMNQRGEDTFVQFR